MADVALPLDTDTSTRLMILECGAYYHPIRCRLVEVDLDDNPDYEAISYTWGDATDQETVHVNGIPVQMRSNLSSFLRRLRRSSGERTFWVDALSISQTDLSEKSRQVAMIGRVFKHAVCVRAWVGEHADNSEALFKPDFDPLNRFHWRWVAIARTRLQTAPSRHAPMSGIILCAGPVIVWLMYVHLRASRWVGLWVLILIVFCILSYFLISILFSSMVFLLNPWNTEQDLWYQVPEWYSFTHRQWFRRTWIVQEVTLARHLIVHCGRDSMTWQDLITARVGSSTGHGVLAVSARKARSMQLRHHPVVLLQLLRESRHEKLIPILAYVTRHTHCCDQRDRMYALLSTEGPRSFAETIVPDYTLSVPELCIQIYRLARDDNDLSRHSLLYCTMKGLKIPWNKYRMVYQLLKPHERAVFLRAVFYEELCVGLSGLPTGNLRKAISG